MILKIISNKMLLLAVLALVVIFSSCQNVNPVRVEKPIPTVFQESNQNISQDEENEAPEDTYDDDVPSELKSIPVIGAGGVSYEDSVIRYYSTESPSKVIAFYKKEMVNLGWQIVVLPPDQQKYDMARFKKGDELLWVSASISPSDNATYVNIIPLGSFRVDKLPRYPGSETIFEEATQRIEVTRDAVSKVTSHIREYLQKVGWNNQNKDNVFGKDSSSMHYYQNDIELSVYISIAPAQDNKTAIQYNARKVKGDS